MLPNYVTLNSTCDCGVLARYSLFVTFESKKGGKSHKIVINYLADTIFGSSTDQSAFLSNKFQFLLSGCDILALDVDSAYNGNSVIIEILL